jgi:putative DNA methylase
MRPKKKGKGFDYEFRSVTEDDRKRERIVEEYVGKNLAEWQEKGWIPDMRIEPGYNTDQPIRERGWTHLFNPRQLLLASIVNRYARTSQKFVLTQILNWNSRLCIWSIHDGGGGAVKNTFMNQALNTLFNYGCRGFGYVKGLFELDIKVFPLPHESCTFVRNHPANELAEICDLFVTDPPIWRCGQLR